MRSQIAVSRGIADKAFRDIRHVPVDKVFATGRFIPGKKIAPPVIIN